MDRNTILTATHGENGPIDADSERRLWTAVLTLAIEDWRNGTLRKKREAEKFLFEEQKDFSQVCSAAGIDASDFRARLMKISRRIDEHRPAKGLLLA